MGLRINTNVSALQAYNNLSANQAAQERAFGQLSSGLRINKAADDAAGLSIAQGLTSQINGLTQAVANANDGINVAQIADGALGSVQDVLQRMRQLVVKAGNEGTQDNNSLTAIQAEIRSLNDQLDKIAEQTKFGQTNLLDGSFKKVFQVGSNGGEVIELDLESEMKPLSTIDYDDNNTHIMAALGLLLNPADSSLDQVTITLGQSAEAKAGEVHPLNIIAFDTNGYDWYDRGGDQGHGSGYGVKQSTTDLAVIDGAIDIVSTMRSQIGAVQNQLTYTVANLQTAITNVSASRSNLMDADLAEQVTAMTQAQVLSQTATSVLAQANSAPQAILQLLQKT